MGAIERWVVEMSVLPVKSRRMVEFLSAVDYNDENSLSLEVS